MKRLLRGITWDHARGYDPLVKAGDSSRNLERSSLNHFSSDERIALCISLGAKSLCNVGARGAGGRQPGGDDCGGQ